ncbi:hypothetical protein SESBI_19766 [Sesbania bispinosa]|nr:hypothetical protein SESBI_19766 [Sesbania bispinosa]
MERRLGRESKGSLSLQKKMAETRRREEPTPDLTDFMNDMFFGTVNTERKTYDLTGGGRGASLSMDDDDDGFDDSTRSNSARLTQEWLQEARRIVASSPSRGDSPGRLVGSPRFAAAQPGSPLPSLDRREALSRTRSARRFRAVEGISDEILLKSAKHSRNKSDTFVQPSSEGDGSPATAVHKWFSNILKPINSNNTPLTPPPPSPDSLPPRQPCPRKSRFQTEPSGTPHPQGIQAPISRRTFKSTSAPSPENPNRRTPPPSSDSQPLSPPKNLVESAHRRTISSSTCSREKIAPVRHVAKGEEEETNHEHSLNGFLKEQRSLFQKISNGEIHANATIVLSGSSNSRERMEVRTWAVVVPVMNVKRGSMWKHRKAAWLFHHAGLDATALLFIDEVDMESLLVTGQLSVLVVGQDVLSTTGEVGSQCTILTDNYCEDAYDLLQNPVLKKLLLAGILLDTQNLKASASVSMTRDAEAVQLLLVGLAPNYRYALFDQSLNHNYGKAPDQSDQNNEGNMEHKARGRKSSSTSDRETTMSSPKTNSIDIKVKLTTPPLQSPTPAPANAEKEASRGKNKFFFSRWFGFGSK